MSRPCEEIEQSMIVGDSPSADQNNHITGCVRCQMTQHMTKQIETELQEVPSSQAHKPLWIREMHARAARVRRRRTWLLGGMCLAAVSTLLLLVLPLGMRSDVPAPLALEITESSESMEETNFAMGDISGSVKKQLEALGYFSNTIDRVKESSEGIQFRLSFRNKQGETAPTRSLSDVIERRLEQQFDIVKSAISGQHLFLEIRVDSDKPTEIVAQVQTMLVPAIGKVRFSIVDENLPLMKALPGRVGDNVKEPSITTGIDSWIHAGTGRRYTDYYLSAEDTDIASGQQILSRYLPNTVNVQTDKSHRFAFGLLENPDAAQQPQRWRTYLLDNTSALKRVVIENASVVWNPESDLPEVLVKMQESTASAFAQLTASNIGRRVAITMDDTVISAPVVDSAIDGHSVAIKVGQNPQVSQRWATDLVEQIEMGPVSVEIDSWTRVGETLSE